MIRCVLAAVVALLSHGFKIVIRQFPCRLYGGVPVRGLLDGGGRLLVDDDLHGLADQRL